MNQFFDSNLGKILGKIARPPSKISQMLLQDKNLIDREECTYNKIHDGKKSTRRGLNTKNMHR
jgi:hypothetical protein